MFRVRATNQAGVGRPSDITDPVVAETRPGLLEMLPLFVIFKEVPVCVMCLYTGCT